MRVAAVSVGTGARALPATGADVQVHSVFGRALNVSVGAGGDLLVLLSAGLPRVPNGVHLSKRVDFLDPRRQFRPAQPVRIHADRIELPALVVSFRDAPTWSADLRVPAVDLVAVRQARSGLRNLPTPAVPVAASLALVNGLVGADAAAVRRAALGLAGLGPGLTPSGDDVLLGCHAVLAAGGHPAADLLGVALLACADRTTAVSATLLRLAARGEHAELTADLACALVGGDAAAARTAATSLFGHGATSGRDTAAGALLGCRVWLGERGTIAPVRTEHAA